MFDGEFEDKEDMARNVAQVKSWKIQHPKNATCHGTKRKMDPNTSAIDTIVFLLLYTVGVMIVRLREYCVGIISVGRIGIEHVPNTCHSSKETNWCHQSDQDEPRDTNKARNYQNCKRRKQSKHWFSPIA